MKNYDPKNEFHVIIKELINIRKLIEHALKIDEKEVKENDRTKHNNS